MNKYEGKDNYGKPKQEYVDRVAAMTVEELSKESESKIWLSAFAANNARSDYHWHVDVIYDEWTKRGMVEKYSEAHKAAMRSAGY